MSKVKLLLEVADGLRNLADSVTAIAEAMQGSDAEDTDTAVSGTQSISGPVSSAPAIPLEQVRAVLADASRAGKTAEVKALLERFGADRLSAIDPAQFSELLIAAEEL